MHKFSIQLCLILAIPVLLVGGMLWFGYRVYTDLQTLKTQVAWLSNTSATNTPLMITGGTVVQNNFAGLCVLSQNPQICQAAGMQLPTSQK